jgi:outer membrane immunogenic protein
MKKFVIASLVAVAFAAPAIAADMPVKAARLAPAAVYNWTGFYVGGNVGYGFGEGNTDVRFVPAAFDATPFSVRTNPKGFVGGAQIGSNWQYSALVLGAEADISYANLRGDGLSAPVIRQTNGLPIIDSFHQAHQETNWLGTARLRLGVTPVDRLLVYATGGLAFGDVKSSAVTSFTGAFVVYSGSASDMQVGWTIGGGLEWALMGNWTVKAEYLYYDLGHQTVTAMPQPIFPQNFHVISTFETKANIVRFGINYKFGNPIIANR